MMALCGNVMTNMTGNKQMYENIYSSLYGYCLPTICAFGFLGNILNLIILAGKRIQGSLKEMERSSNLGLIALAASDLCFCMTAFPSAFLPENMQFTNKNVLSYYGCYCAAIINVFIMASTWITVTMASERYLAICHPLKSRNFVTLQRTKLAITMVYIVSVTFNIPVFWRYIIKQQICDNRTMYSVEMQLIANKPFDNFYRAAWAVLGNFVPFLILLFCNTALMRQIHKSYSLQKQKNYTSGLRSHSRQDQDASNVITITLVAIVVLFFILVVPSEILKHIANETNNNIQSNYTYLTIEIITNVMQSINFSANFIIYCIINPSFRKTMKEMACSHCKKRRSLNSMKSLSSWPGDNTDNFTNLLTDQNQVSHNTQLQSFKGHVLIEKA